MDKNKIKSFAVWARRKMIKSVTEKAERIGIRKDKIQEVEVIQGGFKLGEETFYLSAKDRDALIHQIDEKGFDEVMEEVAYTWFNRFMGLRYMEVNDYLPSGIRILSSTVEGKVEPDVLSKVSDIIEELKLNGEDIYNLLDTGNTTDREKAYRIILVKQCNELGKIIPQMFEKISDYTELLLPDNLLEEGSVIRKMVEDIEESDWKEEVEIIGWMYQYYNIENNELVYDGSMKQEKIPKELLPAATQIFTPDWVVKYMVENSLGKLIISGENIDSRLAYNWKYFIEDKTTEKKEHIDIEKIKFLDPSMGSGHILVYAFEIYYEAYRALGYSEREIPKKILENNLFGLDIDDRASQIAYFALIMKAREYNKRLFRQIEKENILLNITSIKDSNIISDEAVNYFIADNEELNKSVNYLLEVFKDAKEFGSIIKLNEFNFDCIEERLKEINNQDNLMFFDLNQQILAIIPQLILQAKIILQKYNIVVTNPPYLNSSRMSKKLFDYVTKYYADTKADFSMIFYQKVIEDYCIDKGYISFVTTTSWMTLKSFEKIRRRMINELQFETLIDFGTELFDGKVGHNPIVAWVNKKCTANKRMLTIKLSDFCYSRRNEKKIEFFNMDNRYYSEQKKFLNMPSSTIAYNVNDKVINLFNDMENVRDKATIFEGLKTRDKERFLRLWYEINTDKWKPYAKGGSFRRWYGNNEYVVKWGDDGQEIREFKKSSGSNFDGYFIPTITYSAMTSYKFSGRYINNSIFGGGGGGITKTNYVFYLLGFVNTSVYGLLLKIISPNMNFEVGQIGSIPLIIKDKCFVEKLVKQNVSISKNDWDDFETSWDFRVHPLLKSLDIGSQYKLSSIFNVRDTQCEENFEQLKSNEEELNRIFIDIYGLQDELTPEVEDKDVTIRKADRTRDIKSLISYAVGCMFGRYSIDAGGLIYAGGQFDEKWILNNKQCKVRSIEEDDDGNVISDAWSDVTFVPDKDNIIPITEDEYFEDDIVSRFIEFIRTVYGEENLEENLDYIADSIGRKTSESARQAIRRYFIKDFYKDHLKIYQKRPIYWMFDSGKNDGFKCLVYMHRYNDQTVAKVRTDYLHNLQRKYEAEINRHQLVVDSSESTTKDKTFAKKKIDRINKQIEECKEYDEVVAYLANEKISLDLDDGVKVNYAKFQDVKVINSKNKEVKMNLLAKI